MFFSESRKDKVEKVREKEIKEFALRNDVDGRPIDRSDKIDRRDMICVPIADSLLPLDKSKESFSRVESGKTTGDCAGYENWGIDTTTVKSNFVVR